MSSSRRGFFSRLFRRSFKEACFAVQVVIESGDDSMRSKLHALIDGPTEQSPAAKRSYYRKLTTLVRSAEPHFDQAHWEYNDDDREAAASFNTWVRELEGEMATEELETGEDVDGYHRLDAEQQFIVVTFAFLLNRPHPWAEQLDDEDEDTYNRPYIGDLIDSINHLDWEAGVSADAIFLLPGSEEDGLSSMDLADEGWAHLVPLRSSGDGVRLH